MADLRDQFNRMVKFGGDFFVGVRSDRSRVPFFDYSGAARPSNPDHFQNVNAVHDFHLTAHANLAGGVKFTGDLVASNYLGYRAAARTTSPAAWRALWAAPPARTRPSPARRKK